jgi:hypothetical protein
MKTSDLYLAAYLQAIGVPMTGKERIASKYFFVFESTKDLDQEKLNYYNGTGTVSAKWFADAISGLKSLIHSE